MTTSKELTFTRFYVSEFLQEVLNNIPGNVSDDKAGQAEELIRHLTKQDDVTDGIELIAREQGSGELSIFLFDIVDRVEDYPPTVAYDALPDIVDDFVNGLELMLEEEETIAAIEKVNKRFREDTGEVSADELEEDEKMDEPEPLVEEQKEVHAQLPVEDFMDSQMAPSEPEEPEINFEQFFEREFMQTLSTQIEDELESEISSSTKSFIELLFENISADVDPKLSQPLADAIVTMRTAIPWRAGKSYSASALADSQVELREKLVASLKLLSDDSPDIISNSVMQARLVLPEAIEASEVVEEPETLEVTESQPEPQEDEKVTPEFVQEEVPKEPTTIDEILSDYFSSEVEEHITSLSELTEKLKSDPGDKKIIKEMISSLQSFNEISMIHGYAPIEAFCARLIDIFSEGDKAKMEVDLQQISSFPEMFEILRHTDNLKDPKKETEESKKLEDIADILESTLFVPKKASPKKKKKKASKQVKATEKPVTEISFDEKESLAGVIRDILQDNKSLIQKNPASSESRDILSKMQSAAKLVSVINISESIEIFLNAAAKNGKSDIDRLKDKCSEFINAIAADMNSADWEGVLNPKIEADAEIASDNTNQLLAIIAQIEDLNLASFKDELQDIFGNNNSETCQRQLQKFDRLRNNLKLIGAEKKTALADYFCDIFANQENLPSVTDEQRQELVQSYKIFIQSLRSEDSAVNPNDLVEILKEMLSGEATEIVEPVADKTEELVPPESDVTGEDDLLPPKDSGDEDTGETAEEGEEDLAEIFKQEAESSIGQINESLQKLDANISDRQAYQSIERTIHTLKSSARLMGNDDVADLSAPLEDLCEKLASGSFQPAPEHVTLIKSTVAGLTGIVNGESNDISDLIIQLNEVEFLEVSEDATSGESTQKDEAGSEKPLFSDTGDEDDDLLQIFKEESAEFIKLLKEASTDLNKNPADEEAIKKLEYASHSLKSPAKMLGFSEIGQMGDAIENVAESVKNGELTLNKAMVKKVIDGIGYVEQLSEGKKPDPSTMAEIFSGMDINKIKVLVDEEPEDGETSQDDIYVFLTESEDLLGKINHDLLALEKKPEDTGLLDSISRYLHTLKGSAQIMGQEKIGSLAHAIEDIFSYLKDNNQPIPERTSDLVFRAIDGIQGMTDNLKKGDKESGNLYQELILALNNEVDSLQKEEIPVKAPVIKKVEIEEAPEVQKDVEKTIRITTERLDNFVNMAAELVINKSQLSDQLEKLKEIREKIEEDRAKIKKTGSEIDSAFSKKSPDEDSESRGDVAHNFEEILANLDDLSHRVSIITQKFDQNINQISHLSKSLHDNILQVRMVPTEVLFDRFPRAVRDMAKKQKKKINLLVEGEDTEMDRAMIESLTDPVMHLVRNAIDHGIELPKVRKENDKNEDGILLLKARRDKNQVVIEVQDDGKGINVEDIKKTIVRKKLATKAVVAKMSEDEIIDHIFHPGFTTKRTASKVSGRGVGLDVVAEEIQKLKGDIRVSSTPGKGSIFSIRMPLTLAITQAMLVKIKGEVLAIPLNSIEETLDFEKKNISLKDNKKYVKIKNEEIPTGYLSDFIKYDNEETGEPEKGNLLVIQDGSIRYGVIVEKALRREEIVVRSLGDELKKMDFIAGGTIFGDGSVVLIADIPAITRKIEADYFGDQRDFSSLESARDVVKGKTKKSTDTKKTEVSKRKAADIKKKKIEARKPNALIVDDSLSVRKFVSSVLERNNYTTILAEDGPDALDELKTSEFDIIITDLEMPKMQGFELIEKIREQDKLKDVPIVILTGKAAKENKEQGLKLGANAYIVKPFKENDLLKTLDKFIQI